MYADVVFCRDFYRSPAGALAARLINARLAGFWPDLTGSNVVGVGYPLPFLDRLPRPPQRALAFMPARQGILHWPDDWPNRAALTADGALPAADNSIDCLLGVHALEFSRAPERLWREFWRVLSPEGRLILVVPNRQGIWARLDRTPFGHGSPYSPAQLKNAMTRALFEPVSVSGALFYPPAGGRLGRSLMRHSEPLATGAGRNLAGVMIVSAKKRLYTAEPLAQAKPVMQPAGVIGS